MAGITSTRARTWYRVKSIFSMYGIRVFSWGLVVLLAIAIAYAMHHKGVLPHVQG